MEGRRRLSYKLRTPKFDALITALHGEMRVRDVAERMEMNPDNWSQVRSGERDLNLHIIGICEELLPGIPLSTYAERYVKNHWSAS